MFIDPTTNASKEIRDAKAPLSTKGALNWLKKVLSNNTQEISDFADFLTVQSSEGSSSKLQSELLSSPSEKKISQVAYGTNSKPDAEFCESVHLARPDNLSPTTKTRENELTTTAESSGQSEQEISQPIAEEDTELSGENSSEVDPDQAALEPSNTENQLACETLAGQLQLIDNGSQAKNAQMQSDPDVAELELVEEDGSSAALQQNSEQLAKPESFNEDSQELNTFVQKAIQKASQNESGSANDKNLDKSRISELKVNQQEPHLNVQAAVSSQSSENIQLSEQQALNVQMLKAQSPNAIFDASTLAKSVSSQLLQTAFAKIREEVGSVSDVINSVRSSASLGKSISEAGNISLIQSNKATASSNFSAERLQNMAWNANNNEMQKSDSGKSAKPVARSQTLAALEKVEAALKKAAEAKDGSLISLRLDPPSLGSVKVDVSIRDGILHARMSADSVQVLQLLRERAPELQVTLRKLGLDVDKVSVSVNSENSGTTSEERDPNQGSNPRKSGKDFFDSAEIAVSAESVNGDHWVA